MRLLRVLMRSVLLCCPACGRGRLFRGWFSMHERCAHCGRQFQREPGYFLGSIYFNYGATAALVMALYLGLFFFAEVSPDLLLGILTAFCVLFPLWFFRYARSLWLALDWYFDPPPPERAEAGHVGESLRDSHPRLGETRPRGHDRSSLSP
jgi:uncharacterized protein (DUF983 family)